MKSYRIYYDSTYSGPSDSRIKFLVFHYTALSLEESLEALTQGQVSAHYLVPEDAIGGRSLIYRLVPDGKRAWHAGESSWGGRTNLNDSSIGIEVVNRGYVESSECAWHPFTAYQIQALIVLARKLVKAYKIKPSCVLGHSDIAPGRKIDPGPLFPWKELAEAGIGAWPNPEDVWKKRAEYKGKVLDIPTLQQDLKRYGYAIEVTGILDDQTRAVVRAFHMHFMGSDCSEPTLETHVTLLALPEKSDMKV